MNSLPLSLLLSSTGCASAGSVHTSKFVGYRDSGYIRESKRTSLPFKWHVRQLRAAVQMAGSASRALRVSALQPHVDLILADGLSSDEYRTLLGTDFIVALGRERGVQGLLRMLADPSWSAPSADVRRQFSLKWPVASAFLDSINVW